MASKKIITVFGSTGNQGGSVIKTLLAHPDLASQYTIRGVTRDPTKPNAQALKSKGVEPIAADLNDPKSLTSAIDGSTVVYAVTNYWETMSRSTEVTQGKNVVDACINTSVKHLIWSTLPDVTSMTSGALKNVEHFDSKAEVARYAESRKSETGMHVTHFQPGYFMSNVRSLIRRDPESKLLVCAIPWSETTTQIPLLDIAHDTGKYVVGAIELGSSADGADIQAVSQWCTPAELLSTLSRATDGGEEIKFQEIPPEVWAGFLPLPKHGQVELGENMTLIKDWSYYGKGAEKRQADSDRFILEGEKLTTWEEFVEREGPWKW